ncbi:hypothetical protein KUV64_11815 [Mameliella alba]|uniref:hypothetical protein n=1 Tax=Mameliella alba TaxID=561184 RepID=UPI001C96400A|nr:hypothetical protein [Mameliella alba]MBY6119816.1 hypothetical protein [Mameliella alba]
MTWYDFLKDFQTALVGLIGFGGVIIAQFVNGWLSRSRDDALLASEQASIRKALLAELRVLKAAFETEFEPPDPTGQNFTLVPRMYRKVSVGLMDQIGKLNETEAEEVFRALATIDEYDRSLALISSDANEQHFSIPDRAASAFLMKRENLVNQLKPAIDVLSANAKATK